MNGNLLYTEDILGHGFEKMNIPLSNDYQGEAVATLIRRLSDVKSKKAVLYVHGFNDYFFQSEMACRFNREGYNFYAVDLRSYGRSYLPHQKFNDIRNLKAYYEEIDKALKIIHSEWNEEVILMGHSTGGLILTLYAKDHLQSNLFSGLILNSPFYELNKSRFIKMLLPLVSFIGGLLPNVTIAGGFSEEYGKSIHKSYSGEWNYELEWKPNVAPKINLGWLRAIYKAQRELKKLFPISKPVLVLHSAKSVDNMADSRQVRTRDAILNVNDIKRTARNIEGNVQVAAIDGGLHDLVLSQQPVRNNVYSTIFEWLSKNQL